MALTVSPGATVTSGGVTCSARSAAVGGGTVTVRRRLAWAPPGAVSRAWAAGPAAIASDTDPSRAVVAVAP